MPSSDAKAAAEHTARLRAFDEFIAEYEAEHGVITEREMDEAVRAMHARAIVVRPRPHD